MFFGITWLSDADTELTGGGDDKMQNLMELPHEEQCM